MNQHDFNTHSSDVCPRCGVSKLRTWRELDDEEKLVVERLPASAVYELNERKARHRWCTRCWFEDARGGSELTA